MAAICYLGIPFSCDVFRNRIEGPQWAFLLYEFMLALTMLHTVWPHFCTSECIGIIIIPPANYSWGDHMESFKEGGVGPWHLGMGVPGLVPLTGNEQTEWAENESGVSEQRWGNQKYLRVHVEQRQEARFGETLFSLLKLSLALLRKLLFIFKIQSKSPTFIKGSVTLLGNQASVCFQGICLHLSP